MFVRYHPTLIDAPALTRDCVDRTTLAVLWMLMTPRPAARKDGRR